MAHAGLPRMISSSQAASALMYKELIPAIEQALGNFSRRNDEGKEDEGVYPERTLMHIKQTDGDVFVMPVFSGNIIATKIVTRYPYNSERYNLPTHMATILLNDPQTGAPIMVMDGEHITGMRTAAASAVATKYLAREGASTLAILGAGNQARCHIEALRFINKWSQIRLWTRSFEKAQAFSQEFGITACETAREAVTGADVIVTCTSSDTPVLEASWLDPVAHINCVGACVPTCQELGSEVMQKAVVYADSIPAALRESGDVIHSKVEVYAELGDVINSTKEAKRDSLTVFKSQGLAIEDATAAKLVYDKLMTKDQA